MQPDLSSPPHSHQEYLKHKSKQLTNVPASYRISNQGMFLNPEHLFYSSKQFLVMTPMKNPSYQPMNRISACSTTLSNIKMPTSNTLTTCLSDLPELPKMNKEQLMDNRPGTSLLECLSDNILLCQRMEKTSTPKELDLTSVSCHKTNWLMQALIC
jgi:hypothetical protein